MRNEFDLDQLKNTWQNQSIRPHYQAADILEILNKKSQSYIRYILWISFAEFTIFLILNVFAWLRHENSDIYFSQLTLMGIIVDQKIKMSFHIAYFIFKMISLFIILYYAYIFFQKYKKIKIESNLRNFISQIISFKESVNRFIWINIVFLVIFMALITIFPIFHVHQQHLQIRTDKYTMYIMGIIISCCTGIILVFVYYRLVYGILLKKLSQNLQQLTHIEKESA
ncbi:hypothetical protein GNY06_07940 [Elizabethkingia argentiflava]|uniref:Beta-carotene 15,15'-monooxygenase n=1 Tax=Elizabethkingia argenteiflava TaxID=2681556 RepID=A0A845PSV7_9FLAO|nr:hypothetical protein [Elizabethkingia argenteiflava]NAW51312.1 hypothetical protein [Elizabethkingia argenteiflava]